MKDPGNFDETQPVVSASDVNGGGEANLQELRTMALRQRAQLDTQRAQLAAKEQRLRALVAAHGEHERLRRLRERVDAQELKLRRLRALRGQVDANRQINAQLTSDLDSIRALFNEKEKELSLAVAKVDELTRQLDCVRGGGRASQQAPSAAALELDKLRRELMYRNKLNEQQNARLHQQREALTQRQEEVSSIDRRIGELQERLHRKRLLNQRLANQINATSHKAGQHKLVGLDNNQHGLTKQHSRGNIAAVEPYNHIPSSVDGQNNFHVTSNQLNQNDYNNLKNNKDDASVTKNNLKVVTSTGLVKNDNDYITEFTASKSDPKYQTLPYNTKFSVNFVSTTKKRESTASEDKQTSETDSAQQNQTNQKQQAYQQHMTVHSTPLSTINKSLAVALNQNENTYQEKTQKNQQTDLKIGPNNVEQGYQQNALQNITRSQPIGAPLSNATTLHNTTPNNYQKPISSVAPTSVQHTNKHSAIYQTSSTKIQPVQPQTIHPGLTNSPSNIANNNNSQSNVINTQTNPYYSASSVPTSTPNSNAANVPSYIASNNIPPNFNNYPNQGPPNSSSPYFDNIPNSTNTQTSASNFSNNPPPCLNNSPSAFPNFTQPDTTDNTINTNQSDTVPSPCKPILPPKPAIKPPPRQMGQVGFETSENSEQSKESTVKIVGYESKADKRPEKMVYDNKPIKAKPLTIKKQPLGEQPRLKSAAKVNGVHVSINRRIEMPPAFLFPEMSGPSADYGTKGDSKGNNGNKAEQNQSKNASADDLDKKEEEDSKGSEDKDDKDNSSDSSSDKMVMANVNENNIVRRANKGNLKQNGKANLSRRVSFDPLALLLDASLEGELELVARTASQVSNASAANDEGITALHNAICAGHLDIVRFLVDFGCDVNAQDSDGWTPLHCAASCNSLPMVRFLVEHGACIFATTLSDHETAAEKCEEDEEGFDGCSEYLYSVQEKLGILSGGAVYAVFDYAAQQQDELSFAMGERLTVLRKGDESEREWWWARLGDKEGYIPRNLLGLYPRVTPKSE